MDKLLKDVSLGENGDLKLELKEGKLLLAVGYTIDGVTAGLSIAVSPDVFIDKLAAAIPGEIDDMVFGMLKAAIKA